MRKPGLYIGLLWVIVSTLPAAWACNIKVKPVCSDNPHAVFKWEIENNSNSSVKIHYEVTETKEKGTVTIDPKNKQVISTYSNGQVQNLRVTFTHCASGKTREITTISDLLYCYIIPPDASALCSYFPDSLLRFHLGNKNPFPLEISYQFGGAKGDISLPAKSGQEILLHRKSGGGKLKLRYFNEKNTPEQLQISPSFTECSLNDMQFKQECSNNPDQTSVWSITNPHPVPVNMTFEINGGDRSQPEQILPGSNQVKLSSEVKEVIMFKWKGTSTSYSQYQQVGYNPCQVVPLEVFGACSEMNEIRWRMVNPNDFHVPVTWSTKSNMSVKEIRMPPGEKEYSFPAHMKDPVTLLVSWQAPGQGEVTITKKLDHIPCKQQVLETDTYPNPVRGMFYFRLFKGDPSLASANITPDKVSAYFYDTAGRLVYKDEAEVDAMTGAAGFNLIDLPPNLYQVQIQAREQTYFYRIIKD